jgi:hypothetical protein
VHVTIQKLTEPFAEGNGVIRTYAAYPDCIDVPIAAAVFDAATGEGSRA